MVFITIPRTDASREETRRCIAAALAKCSNPFGRKKQHAHATLGLLAGDNLLHIVIGLFFELIDYCLSDSDRRLVHSQRFSSRGLWPCSTEDLLPFGPQQSFLSLVHWLAVREDTLVMTAFEDIFLACRDELAPVIMQDTNRRLFANAIVYQLHNALNWLKRERAKGNPPGPGNFSPQVRIFTLNGVLYNILRTLSPDQQLLSGTPVPLVKGYELDLLKCIEEALDLVELGEERNRLISVATTLHGSVGTLFEERPGDLRLPILSRSGHAGHAANVLHRMIYGLRQQHACGAADCTVRERDVGRRLQRCAGCGILQYCSKDCQRRDWKVSETPHKAVCASLKRLAPLLDLNAGDFHNRVRAMNVTYDELALIYVNLRHGNIPEVKPGPCTISEKVQHMSTILRLNDSLAGEEGSPLPLDALRDAMMQLGVKDLPYELQLAKDVLDAAD
ncbi:hypothetical protein EXIGLDRAFT_730822 [Exidia glandulosa HHB12029]|uniref:MYND-type domain-containing protein n=1 Tax=Exidia glandulosa HHB12029 TaxID=1314781 RepID=A0A165C1C7_EXIGL|nr:hypothetical protein EXIGLDRAFT_730822 [Exidia glandulosa HHB12029]